MPRRALICAGRALSRPSPLPIASSLLALPVLLAALAGCGPAETGTGAGGTTSSSSAGGSDTGGGGSGGSTGVTGGGGSGAGGSTGVTGGGGSGAGGSTGGSGGGGLCGNGAIDAAEGESCDGADLGGLTCQTQGYAGGTLACTADCTLDVSACSGAESCTNGVDDDGDLLVDCDEADCQAACDDPCLAPVPLADPDFQGGATAGHANLLQPSCAAASGAEVVYTFTAAATGALEATLVTAPGTPLGISLRSTCGADASEVACTTNTLPDGLTRAVSAPVTAGQTLFIVVDGDGAAATGVYTLEAHTREVQCGDQIQDAPETCDDGNTASGDGCSAACALESSETEPNGTIVTADAISAPFFAQIAPAGDVDFVAVTLGASSGLVVSTAGLAFEQCTDGSMDSDLALLDAAGNVLASNDDHGGLCSEVSIASLPAGTYYARVRAPAKADAAGETFPYLLSASTYTCGDGALQAGEECDDGNLAPNDGCSAACEVEVDESEPNDTTLTADVYTSPWVARVDPDGDVDVVAVTVPGPASEITATTSVPGGPAQCASPADTFVEILAPGGAVLAMSDDAPGLGLCSSATASGLAAGTYFVRTQAQPFVGAANVLIFTYELDVQVQ